MCKISKNLEINCAHFTDVDGHIEVKWENNEEKFNLRGK